MTEVAVTEALGESLSPSQVTTYLTCPAKWNFRYLVGLCEPATGVLTLGKAFHDSTRHWHGTSDRRLAQAATWRPAI